MRPSDERLACKEVADDERQAGEQVDPCKLKLLIRGNLPRNLRPGSISSRLLLEGALTLILGPICGLSFHFAPFCSPRASL